MVFDRKIYSLKTNVASVPRDISLLHLLVTKNKYELTPLSK